MEDKTIINVNNESGYSIDELSIFKRYLEENIVSPENNFEFVEENLSYYSTRFTSDGYFSLAEYYHVNSNYLESDELKLNAQLYEKAIEWHSSHVHPIDSEHVIKKEKYVYYSDLLSPIRGLVNFLNKYPKENFFICDILIYFDGEIFQYLPQKNFIFKRKATKIKFGEIKYYNRDFLWNHFKEKGVEISNVAAVFPVFIPIRKMIFFGEYGYRSGLIEYGRVTERLRTYFDNNNILFIDSLMYEHAQINDILGLDGIERSIQNVFFWDQDS